MKECEYRNRIKYGFNSDYFNACGNPCYYCSLFGERCYHIDEKTNCEIYFRASEFERKNHLCESKPRDIWITLIEGDKDIKEIKRCNNRIENDELSYGWYMENYMNDPEDACIVYKFVKIKYCPFCGKQLTKL